MRTYKLTGITLKTIKLGDADKLIVLYSKGKGKVYLKAKGIRRIKSKLAGHLGGLSLVSLEIAKGKGDIDVITGAISQSIFENVKNDLKKISLAYYFAELFDKLLRNEQENKEAYILMEESLQELNKKDQHNLDFLKVIFQIKLIKILGHAPVITNCVECNNKISENKIIKFDFEKGGVICGNCETSHNYRSVEFSLLKTYNAINKLEIRQIIGLKIEEDIIKKLDLILLEFKKYAFERTDYKSENLLKKVMKD